MVSGHPFAVLHVPHASRVVPPDARGALLLPDDALAAELLRMTDAHTDDLFALPPDVAATVHFPVSRLVVDPERFADDALERMAARGMGAVYTRTSLGGVLREPPTSAERARLLEVHYAPHHERLTRAVDDALARWDACLVVDCHSFASRALPHEPDQAPDRPEICLGTDAFHTPPALAAAAAEAFRDEGFDVVFDRPFAGALVPARHYERDARVSAVMVEVNRGLYMDEASGDRLAGYDRVRARVRRAATRTIERAREAVTP